MNHKELLDGIQQVMEEYGTTLAHAILHEAMYRAVILPETTPEYQERYLAANPNGVEFTVTELDGGRKQVSIRPPKAR